MKAVIQRENGTAFVADVAGVNPKWPFSRLPRQWFNSMITPLEKDLAVHATFEDVARMAPDSDASDNEKKATARKIRREFGIESVIDLVDDVDWQAVYDEKALDVIEAHGLKYSVDSVGSHGWRNGRYGEPGHFPYFETEEALEHAIEASKERENPSGEGRIWPHEEWEDEILGKPRVEVLKTSRRDPYDPIKWEYDIAVDDGIVDDYPTRKEAIAAAKVMRDFVMSSEKYRGYWIKYPPDPAQQSFGIFNPAIESVGTADNEKEAKEKIDRILGKENPQAKKKGEYIDLPGGMRLEKVPDAELEQLGLVRLPRSRPMEFSMNGGPWIPGYSFRGDNWNGWAVPYFTKEQGMKVIDTYGRTQLDDPKVKGDLRAKYNPQRDAFIVAAHLEEPQPDPDELNPEAKGIDQPEVFEAEEVTMPSGKKSKLYSIGGYSWVWEERPRGGHEENPEIGKPIKWGRRRRCPKCDKVAMEKRAWGDWSCYNCGYTVEKRK